MTTPAQRTKGSFRPDEISRPVVGLSYDYEPGHLIPRHRHKKAQLLHAVSGVMTVTTDYGIWVVPPMRAVWLPPETDHQIALCGRVAMRTLYLTPAQTPRLAEQPCVVSINALLRELIVRAVELPQPYPLGGAHQRLVSVLLDELALARAAPLHVPTPRDPKLLPIVHCLRRDPADDTDLETWGRKIGASGRTLARLFVRETGLTFGRWRRQLRLQVALERLAAGDSVTAVALTLGYESVSAFVAMFRQNLGETPGRYFDAKD